MRGHVSACSAARVVAQRTLMPRSGSTGSAAQRLSRICRRRRAPADGRATSCAGEPTARQRDQAEPSFDRRELAVDLECLVTVVRCHVKYVSVGELQPEMTVLDNLS